MSETRRLALRLAVDAWTAHPHPENPDIARAVLHLATAFEHWLERPADKLTLTATGLRRMPPIERPNEHG